MDCKHITFLKTYIRLDYPMKYPVCPWCKAERPKEKEKLWKKLLNEHFAELPAKKWEEFASTAIDEVLKIVEDFIKETNPTGGTSAIFGNELKSKLEELR